MSDPLVWVVGSGGLLGGAVWRELGALAWRPAAPFRWSDPSALSDDFRASVSAFAAAAAAEPARRWAIAWCAGAGVVATSAAALDAEVAAFGQFLQLLGNEASLMASPGAVVLASSAGGVYGGSDASPITESTPPAPISAYGHAKLASEASLAEWSRERANVSTLVARFSNLYGPEQRLDKPQGLISHLSRSSIYGAPVHVYVSLDTIRDFLFAEDAGRGLVLGLRRLTDSDEAQRVTKIYASERAVSIAGLVAAFRHIARRRLRIVSGLAPATSLQPRRLQFRSQVWASHRERQVELIEGVSRVYAHQLALFRRGLLPAPPIRR
jgi:UDP-glucose 4-epimerase